MKIAMTTPYYPPADGGIAIFIRELCSELRAREHDVKIFARYGDEKVIEKIEGRKLKFVSKASKGLKEFQPDVVHAHSTWYALAAGVRYKTKYNPDSKLIFTFHTGHTDDLQWMKKRLFSTLLNKCDYVTFVSNALKNEKEKSLNIKSKKVVVYGGAKRRITNRNEIDLFKKKHNILDDEFIITFIGPYEWKMKVEGIKLLIKAFKEVRKSHEKSRLLLVGDGTFRRELEELVNQYDLKDHVVFAGFVPNVFVPLQLTTLYAHISLQEGLPLGLLEAMAAGVPVVASKTGGIPEVIIDEENGLLVDSDIASISAAILRIAQDDALSIKLKTNSINDVDIKYTWINTAKHFLQLYTEGQP